MPNFLAWDESKLERYFNALYDGDFNNKNLPPDLYEAILDKLTEGVAEGFGDFEPGSQKAKVFTGLVDNLAVFSAAKTYQQINDMQNFIFDSKGFKRPFSEFKEAANEIFDTYNDNWLKTEYNTAIGQSRSAANWADYERDKEALPMLKYSTVGDGRVRDEHRDLDGIIKPVGDPFWDTNAPLNGFGCRCILIQLEEGEETDLDKLEKDLGRPIEKPNKLFRYNPGKQGLVFDESVHPYFKVDKRYKIGKKGGGVAVKQPPRKPPVTKIEQPPKVIPTSVAPAVFKSSKAAKDYLKRSVEKQTGVKVGRVSASSNMDIEDFSTRVNHLDNLLKEYKVDEAVNIASTEGLNISFKSGTRTLGQVTHAYRGLTDKWRLKAANFGDKNGSLASSKYIKGETKTRWSSAVDEQNLNLATLTHEFAHFTTISDLTKSAAGKGKTLDFWKEIKELRIAYYKELNTLKAADNLTGFYDIHLGKYAGTDYDEFVAEGFKEYKLKAEPSKYAQKIGLIFDKYYKR